MTEHIAVAYSFEVHYEPDEAAEAERQFFLHAMTKLRRWRTFLPPIGFATFLALTVAMKQPPVFAIIWAALLVLSLASPVFFYFARPAAVRRDTRAFPTRHFDLREDAMLMTREGRTATIAWPRVQQVWQVAGHELVVIGPFLAVSLPLRDMPAGAHEFILAHAGRQG